MNNIQPLYCPTCPEDRVNTRQKDKHIVCGECYRLYVTEAGIALAKDGKNISIFDWVVNQAPSKLIVLEEAYAIAGAEFNDLEKKVLAEAVTKLKEATGGGNILDDVWKRALQEKKAELWKQKGGHKKYAIMKGLQGRIDHLKMIIAEAEKKAEQPPNTAIEESETPSSVELKSGGKNRKPRNQKDNVKNGKPGKRSRLVQEVKNQESKEVIKATM